MNIELSVIVPVYNAEKFLHRCIDSILNQNISMELLLVNDGSSDKSGSICDEYAEKDKRVKVIHKVNGGPNSARNMGLDHVRGKYITFVDADDEIAPNTFIQNIEILNSLPDVDILQYPEIGIRGNERKIWYNYPTHEHVVEGLDNLMNALLGENAIIPGGLWGKIYKKEIWENIRLRTDLRFCEDMIMLPIVFKKIQKFFISTVGEYRYIWNDESACHSEYTPAKCLDVARSAYELYKVRLEYRVNVLASWNNAVKACINAWSFCGKSEELKSYLKDLEQNKDCMRSKSQVQRMVKLSRILSPLSAARIKWLLVRVLFLNKY